MSQARKRATSLNEHSNRSKASDRKELMPVSATMSAGLDGSTNPRFTGARPSSHLYSTYHKTLSSLLSLLPQSEGFIATFSPSRAAEIEIASTGFSTIEAARLNWGRTPFKELFAAPNQSLVISADSLRHAWPQFNLQAGDVALIAVHLAGDTTAILGIFQPFVAGPMSQDKLLALRAQAELLELAASSTDLATDVQVQQLRMEKMRSELAEVQLFFRQFSEAVSQCFWILDTEARKILLVSENFERVWGSNRVCLNDGLTGFVSTVFPADRDWVLSQFHLRFGEDLDLEFRVMDEQGELRWIWLRSFTSEDLASSNPANVVPSVHAGTSVGHGFGHSQRLVLIADDVTERKQEEERLRNAEAMLASRAKMTAVGELANGVAHEINNPLTVIVGRASELARAAERNLLDPVKVAETAEKIRSTSIRISQIIASLKSLARKDLGKAVFHPYPLARVVNEMSDLCAEKFKNQGVTLEISKIPETLKVEMDPTLISQLVLNLLNNGADAIEKESSKWVKVDFTEDRDSVYLFVTDSGSGIPLKIRSRIFDPFFTTKDPGRGTGLGLSLSANIALHHHGVLQYDHLCSHTRFVLQLPKLNPNGPAAAMREHDIFAQGEPSANSDSLAKALKKLR